MTSLVLNKIWLNRTDTGEAISGASARERGSGWSMDGEVRTYASGRRRAISIQGLKGEVSRTLVQVDFATKEKLITWMGANLQMRDHRGQKFFGVFFAVDVREYMRPDLYAVTVTLQTTTTEEGV
jgi:hypothetical protein